MSTFDYKNHPMLKTAGMVAGATTAVLAVLALKYPDRAIFDEHREGIACRPGWPLLGSLPALLANNQVMHDFLLEGFTQTDAMTVTMSAFGMPRSIATIDPRNVEHILKTNFENYAKGPKFNDATEDLLGHGIFNANGEQWKYQRKTASHIFNVKNFRDHFTDVFLQEIDYMSKYIFDPALQNNETVDFHEIMFKFTLDSFILLGFGVQLNSLATKDKVPFATSFDECQLNAFQRFVNPFSRALETASAVFRPWKMSIQQHLDVVNSFANDVIDGRRRQLANGEDHRDLLSRFMNARNENGEPLDNKELRDIVLNFVIAGRDTTAQALSWTFYNLMLHPRVEAKLLEEVHQHIEDDMDAAKLYEVIKEMKYAHAVFFEVLRLHPSVPNNQKYALNDDIYPDGTHIRKGDYVMWSPWVMARSEKVWGSDAKLFRPERWFTPEGELRRESQGQWPAFHAGPRVCLGQNLATLEALVAIVYLVKRYRFTLVPDQKITYQVSLTLPMKNGMKVFVHSR
ncbi:Protein kinase alk2 [Apophysomyces ossiformis]|uniref:Protein kinase alk2 n=1 Tax=Apophysomyces ossiformis TaxID=679940 RepID=A0A8H7ENT9_9FUNG|nr:Protein kinase alk2 [Apophysomyces ossiformis]